MQNKRSKAILLITPQPFFQPRGSPIRVKFDSEALSELGYRVDLLAFPFGEDPKITGVRVLRSWNPLPIRNLPVGPSFAKAILDVFLFFKALKLTGRCQYDYVHCIEDAGIIGSFLKMFRGSLFVYEKHSDAAAYRGGFLRNLSLHLYELIEAIVIRHADLIFGGRGLVRQILTADSDARIQTVDNIPTSLVEPCMSRMKEIRAWLRLTEGELLLTYMGSYAPYQGVDLLIEAIPTVVQRATDVKFLIVGGSDGEIAAKKRWLSSQRVLHKAIFLSPIPPDEAPHYLAASDILLAPRKAGRTIGTKIFDYLRAERPIVATNHTSNRKILNESNALLTSPTPEAFAEGILCLTKDPALRNHLAKNAQRVIKGRYDYESFKQWVKIGYEKLDSIAVEQKCQASRYNKKNNLP